MAEHIPIDEDAVAQFSSPEVIGFASEIRTTTFQLTAYSRQLLAETNRLHAESGEKTIMSNIIEMALREYIAQEPQFEHIRTEAVLQLEHDHARTVRLAALESGAD